MNIGDKLSAKCPYCDKGCEKCSNGYTEVTFGTEDSVMYSLICNDCGTYAGGGFLDAKTARIVASLSKGAICPNCGGQNLKRLLKMENN